MPQGFDPAAALLDDLAALRSLFSGAVVCVDAVAAAALETATAAEQLLIWGACNVVGVHQAQDVQIAASRAPSIDRVVFLLGAHHKHARDQIDAIVSLLPQDRAVSLALVAGCVLDLKVAGDHIPDQGQFDSYVSSVSASSGRPAEAFEMPALSMVHLTSFASLLGAHPGDGDPAPGSGSGDGSESTPASAGAIADQSSSQVQAIVLKLIMATCARGFKTEVFALGAQAHEIASEFVVMASTMLKRADNMDKLSLVIVDRLLDVSECFRLAQPLVRRDPFCKDCDRHPAATRAALAAALRPSCPVYVRDLDYETSRSRLAAKLRRQSLDLLQAERRSARRSDVRLGQASGSQVLELARLVEDQNWQRYVAGIVEQQQQEQDREQDGEAERVRIAFREMEKDIQASLAGSAPRSLPDIVHRILGQAEELGGSGTADRPAIGKEAFALCLRSMVLCREPLPHESLRAIVRFCRRQGLAEWLRIPGEPAEDDEVDDEVEDPATALLGAEILHVLQRMQKEQLAAWDGRPLVPMVSSYLLRSKDIPGMIHVPASLGGLLNSSLGRIGFQKKTLPSMRNTVVIYVTGGITSRELCELQRTVENEAHSPIRLFLLSERVDAMDAGVWRGLGVLQALST